MRYDDRKRQTHERVVKVAARSMRANGPEGAGVAQIMAKAGLTHGGFYAHFASKDDLVCEAIARMFVEARRQVDALGRDRAPAEALSQYVDFYLSSAHRDSRDRGCPLPALAADVPRLSTAARKAFSSGVEGLTRLLAAQLLAIGHVDAASLAPSLLSELAGAVALARSVDDPRQSEAILAATRESVRRRTVLGEKAAVRRPRASRVRNDKTN